MAVGGVSTSLLPPEGIQSENENRMRCAVENPLIWLKNNSERLLGGTFVGVILGGIGGATGGSQKIPHGILAGAVIGFCIGFVAMFKAIGSSQKS